MNNLTDEELFSTLPELLDRYLVADPKSIVPIEYQDMGDYHLSDTGVHHFFLDSTGHMDVETVYGLPFIAYFKDNMMYLKFFTGKDQVDIQTIFDVQLTNFKSVSAADQKKISKYISYSIMKIDPREHTL